MDKFVIRGGAPLSGRLKVNGSKNSALPILIATLLTDEACVIDNVPLLRDIRTTFRLLETLGKKVTVEDHTVRVEAHRPLKTRAPYDLVKQMRASILVAGPLLARFGEVRVPLPGGCAIGMRPIDIHLKAFVDLGASCRTDKGDVVLTAKTLRPGKVRFKFPSVGATENLMIAAAALSGRTVIENAAREPEIEDLANFLTAMGARVRGAGTARVEVLGRPGLRGVRHRVIPDRIETGTYLLACAAAGGKIFLEDAVPHDLEALLRGLERAGAKVRREAGGIGLAAPKRLKPVSIVTAPHPGFPTDLQAPWMACMTLASGNTHVREEVFERRFLHAAELARLGALISVDGDAATVSGVSELQGASIMASDIRAGAALVVAGLAAKGTTEIQRVYHIDRGYERIEERLKKLGARIRRVAA
ncbi:MAG TPA: UDP-N-acetylglucosamine 1-carboxyvinyltransferase [Elusimicrobiota bacterium]|nr:UDP-N-acetylglucosamine 1-carboxyvinyltransferase [Elusimicrobiota bacterium]